MPELGGCFSEPVILRMVEFLLILGKKSLHSRAVEKTPGTMFAKSLLSPF